jgi:hypothetical protein
LPSKERSGVPKKSGAVLGGFFIVIILAVTAILVVIVLAVTAMLVIIFVIFILSTHIIFLSSSLTSIVVVGNPFLLFRRNDPQTVACELLLVPGVPLLTFRVLQTPHRPDVDFLPLRTLKPSPRLVSER